MRLKPATSFSSSKALSVFTLVWFLAIRMITAEASVVHDLHALVEADRGHLSPSANVTSDVRERKLILAPEAAAEEVLLRNFDAAMNMEVRRPYLDSQASIRLFDGWLAHDVTPEIALRLFNREVEQLFRDGIIRTWGEYVSRYLRSKIGPDYDKLLKFRLMLVVLRQKYQPTRLYRTISYWSSNEGGIAGQLYRAQLRFWNGLNISPTVLRRTLKLESIALVPDDYRLEMWMDYAILYSKLRAQANTEADDVRKEVLVWIELCFPDDHLNSVNSKHWVRRERELLQSTNGVRHVNGRVSWFLSEK